MKIAELTPTNGRKSFNGKAKMITKRNKTQLLSYDTVVAEYNHKENKLVVNGYYSPTTANHINTFAEYFGFDKMTKKEMENFVS
jgi:hypothetical protein